MSETTMYDDVIMFVFKFVRRTFRLCDYHPSNSPLISKFRLTVDPQFTDYMLCNRFEKLFFFLFLF